MERRFKDLIEHIEVPLDTVKKAEELLCQEEKKQGKLHTKLEHMTYHLNDYTHKKREHILAVAVILVVVCSTSIGGVALFHARRDVSYHYSKKYPGVGEERWFYSSNTSTPEATESPSPQITNTPETTKKPVQTKTPVQQKKPKKTVEPTEIPVQTNRVADELRAMVITNEIVKIGNSTVIDLNGDSNYDQITYQYSEDRKAFILTVGKSQLIIEEEPVKHQLYLGAIGSNGELFVIVEEVNENWNKRSEIYHYNGTELSDIGTIEGCVEEARVLDDNLLVTKSRSDLVNTWTKTHYYVIEYDDKTGMTSMKEMEKSIEMNQVSKLLQDVETYPNKDVDAPTTIISKDTIVMIVETDDKEWIKLQEESAQQDIWIHLDPETKTILLPDQTQVSLEELLLLGPS